MIIKFLRIIITPIVENNYLTSKQIDAWSAEMKSCQTSGGDCGSIVTRYEELSTAQQQQLISDCAANPSSCQQKYGDVLTDSLAVKQAIDRALGEDIPIKMVYDLTATFAHQMQAEGVVATQKVSVALQKEYGLDGVQADIIAGAAAAAQAGKNSAENNFLGATSSDMLDKAIEKIKQGDKSLATANELIKLENADKRSDALVAKFNTDPSQMNSTEQAELAAYLRVYASEMEQKYGAAVSQELVRGLLSGQGYIKRDPDSKAMREAQTIMNTWGYHKSNASIGDPALLFGSSVLGNTIREGVAVNAAIGAGVNTVSQLSGNDPFSYVDVIMAGITSAATTGKGILPSAGINMGGAAVGSGIKGEDPTNAVVGAGVGTIAGSGAGKLIKNSTSKVIQDKASDITGAIGGGYVNEKMSGAVKETLDVKDKKNER